MESDRHTTCSRLAGDRYTTCSGLAGDRYTTCSGLAGDRFGFKLHLIVNDYGEILNFQVTPANVDERKVVPELTEGIVGKFWGDHRHQLIY